jgi:hypothetical protein
MINGLALSAGLFFILGAPFSFKEDKQLKIKIHYKVDFTLQISYF